MNLDCSNWIGGISNAKKKLPARKKPVISLGFNTAKKGGRHRLARNEKERFVHRSFVHSSLCQPSVPRGFQRYMCFFPLTASDGRLYTSLHVWDRSALQRSRRWGKGLKALFKMRSTSHHNFICKYVSALLLLLLFCTHPICVKADRLK